MGALAALLALLTLGSGPAQALSLEIGLNTTGAFRSDESFSFPPDTMGGVGDEYVVLFINGVFRVLDKSDGTVVVSQSDRRFWQEAGLDAFDVFDPRVVYDPGARRWYAVEVAERRSPESAYLFAVSDGADPTAGWTGFRIDGDSTDEGWVDFPTLGYDADSVFLSSSVIDESGVSFSGIRATSVVVLPKDDLLAPVPTIEDSTHFENIPLNELSLTPQQTLNLDGTDVPAPIVASAGVPGAAQFARIAGTAREPVLEGLGASGFVLLDPVDGGTPMQAPQPGGVAPLDAGNSDFPSRLVLRNGSLWGTRLVNSAGRTAIQWFEFDPADGSVRQSGLISDPDLSFLYPSIAVNENDEIVIGFSGSSENQFASAYAVLGTTVAGETSFGEPLLLREGEAGYEILDEDLNRWGDYSATVIDPEDSRVFWTFQEWAAGGSEWAVQITQLVVVPEPGTALLLAAGLAGLALRRRA